MSSSRQFISKSQATAPFFVGIDLGGTSIKAGVVDAKGQPLSYHTAPTGADGPPEEGAQRMGRLALEVIEQAGLKPADIARVGLGSPGTMDLQAGMLLDPPNLPRWSNFPIVERVEAACGLPVTFANDAGAAAFGEYWLGAGRELNSIVMLTLGTGVGCGIIINDFSVDGEHSHGAECGHNIIDCRDDARVCSCGSRGHLEAYASATAVIKRTHEALDAGHASTLADRRRKGEEVTPLMVNDEAAAGDPLALELVLETARYLGIGIVTLLHTIDPAGVILGGAMTFGGNETELGRRFLARVKQEVVARALPIPAKRVTIDFATLGSDAGYIGAAGLARVEHARR